MLSSYTYVRSIAVIWSTQKTCKEQLHVIGHYRKSKSYLFGLGTFCHAGVKQRSRNTAA